MQNMECKLFLTIINYARYHIDVLLSWVLYPIWEADEVARTRVNSINQYSETTTTLNILKQVGFWANSGKQESITQGFAKA